MKKLISRKVVLCVLLLGALGGAFGVWVLLHPASIWVQPWRAQQSTMSEQVIFGPYPVEEDFVALKKRGVTTIISLLDSNIPYEKVLLAQERERAARHGMQVRNFPMASILGQSFGADYVRNSEAAARAAIDADGTAYIHCYLGLHRAGNVQKLLAKFHATSSFDGSQATARSADTQLLDRANFAFLEADYETTLGEIARMKQQTIASMQLAGWANYRLDRIDTAREQFDRLLELSPDDTEAMSGMAYCALRSGDLADAEARFNQILARLPEDVAALEGLGHVKYRQGNPAEARSYFQRALARSPGNPETRQMLEKLQSAPVSAAGQAVHTAD